MSFISSILQSILKILENVSGWLLAKSKDTEITDNEKAKKEQALKDEINKIIAKAHETGNLTDVRKKSSE